MLTSNATVLKFFVGLAMVTASTVVLVTAASASGKVSTGTSLSSSRNSSFTSGANSSVTLTATVTAAGIAVTAGTVDFTDGGTTIAGCKVKAMSGSGQATCTTTFTAEGDHFLDATYSGATSGAKTYLASSGSLTQAVNNHTTVNGNTYCNTGSISIPDNTETSPGLAVPYPSEMFVSGQTATVGDVKASLSGLTYPHVQDLEVLLVGPAGGSLVLMSSVGASEGDPAANNVNLAFDDAAESPLPESFPLTSGTFKPTDYGTTEGFPAPAPATFGESEPFGTSTLDEEFGDTDPNGTWSLYVITDAPGDGPGQISSGWCLALTGGMQNLTSTTVSSSQNPSFTASPDNDVAFTATVTQESDSAAVTDGSVSFTSDNTVISGCGSQQLNSSGQATCATSYAGAGDYTVEASYGGSASFAPSDGTVNQKVVKHTVAISPSSLPHATVKTAYSVTLSAKGGMSPYHWKRASGTLPAGLSLSASKGVISGTPTKVGTFDFTVAVTDSSHPALTAKKAYSLTVKAKSQKSPLNARGLLRLAAPTRET